MLKHRMFPISRLSENGASVIGIAFRSEWISMHNAVDISGPFPTKGHAPLIDRPNTSDMLKAGIEGLSLG